jgi:N-acetylglucosamine kinase-like BadF-type ATPase
MEEFIAKMTEKVGIDKSTAEKVMAFLKDHAEDAVKYIQSSGVADKLPGGLGDKLGKLF